METLRLDFMPQDYNRDLQANPEKYYLEPFCVAGNCYFIGTEEIGCYLIDSGEGLIILDTGFDFSAAQFIHSIWSLGFRPEDVRMIFHTHNHRDHTACTKFLVRLSGATTYMGEADGLAMAEEIRHKGPSATTFVPDVLTHDGDTFTLGNVTIRCYDTPGHSRGNQSFFFNVTAKDGGQYTAALHGGLGINTLHREFMEATGYTASREEFFSWIDRMKDWKVDIYLGSHTCQAHTVEKLAQRAKDPDGPNPFIDPTEWRRVLTIAENMAKDLIQKETEGKVRLDFSTGYPTVITEE